MASTNLFSGRKPDGQHLKTQDLFIFKCRELSQHGQAEKAVIGGLRRFRYYIQISREVRRFWRHNNGLRKSFAGDPDSIFLIDLISRRAELATLGPYLFTLQNRFDVRFPDKMVKWKNHSVTSKGCAHSPAFFAFTQIKIARALLGPENMVKVALRAMAEVSISTAEGKPHSFWGSAATHLVGTGVPGAVVPQTPPMNSIGSDQLFMPGHEQQRCSPSVEPGAHRHCISARNENSSYLYKLTSTSTFVLEGVSRFSSPPPR